MQSAFLGASFSSFPIELFISLLPISQSSFKSGEIVPNPDFGSNVYHITSEDDLSKLPANKGVI
jgi:hypothetical protein